MPGLRLNSFIVGEQFDGESLEFENSILLELSTWDSSCLVRLVSIRWYSHGIRLMLCDLRTESCEPNGLHWRLKPFCSLRKAIYNETTYGKWENTITSVITGIETRFWSPQNERQNNRPLWKAFQCLKSRHKNGRRKMKNSAIGTKL